MEGAVIQDRISRGLGTAARHIGVTTDAFRPKDPWNPLAKTNRFLRLKAAFSAPDGRFGRPSGYGSSLWFGVFDSAYTRPGDYLVQDAGTWFIAAQQHLLPPLCVQSNRIVSFSRPQSPRAIGVNTYGGVFRPTAQPLLTGWPASVLTGSSGARPTADLPSDAESAQWTVLVPVAAGVTLRSADLMSDDLGRLGVVTAAELTDLGWRVVVKQATT